MRRPAFKQEAEILPNRMFFTNNPLLVCSKKKNITKIQAFCPPRNFQPLSTQLQSHSKSQVSLFKTEKAEWMQHDTNSLSAAASGDRADGELASRGRLVAGVSIDLEVEASKRDLREEGKKTPKVKSSDSHSRGKNRCCQKGRRVAAQPSHLSQSYKHKKWKKRIRWIVRRGGDDKHCQTIHRA